VHDRRWISGDRAWETDDNPLPLVVEDIEVMQSNTVVEITYFDFNLQSCNQVQICRYKLFCEQYGSTKYDIEHY